MSIPHRKISETIIDFGAPLIAHLDADQSIETVRAVFETVITVWNAHVTAMPVWGEPQFLEQLERRLGTAGFAPQAIEACRALAARRRQHFADDPRAVGEWSVTIDHARRVRLHCDARVPPSLLPQLD
jgi:hypothetical protein